MARAIRPGTPPLPISSMDITTSSLLSQFNTSLCIIGLEEYSETLVSHGYNKWDDLVEVSEETLADLGMRLGHRRRLQREIASCKGQPRTKALYSTTTIDDEVYDSDEKSCSPQQEDSPELKTEAIRVKRRYRHRQRKDPRAPRRPSCAYVLFGNSLRQQPEVAELSFVEISKVVGERWQQLAPDERRMWTSTVADQKSKYMTDMAEYQKSQSYQDHLELLRKIKSRQGERRLATESSHTNSPENPSTSASWKSSNVTLGASDDGSYSVSDGRRSGNPYFESSSSTVQHFAEEQGLDLAHRCKEENQLAPNLCDATLQDLTGGSQTMKPLECITSFTADPSQIQNGSTTSSVQTGSERHRSFHTQVLNPFRIVASMEIWQMLESYLRKVNNFYYCVNPELLIQQFHLAVDGNTDLSNQVLCTLCLCVSIGCQSRAAGTNEMAIMWYENGRRYLDDDDWGWNLDVMRALALISIFHRSNRPSTSRHYLDIALRIGEANNLAAQLNNPVFADSVLIWETIRRMAGLGFSSPITPNETLHTAWGSSRPRT